MRPVLPNDVIAHNPAMARPFTITLRLDHLEFIQIMLTGILDGLRLAEKYIEQARDYLAHIMAGRDPDAPRTQWNKR